jgi:hypothetical protein
MDLDLCSCTALKSFPNTFSHTISMWVPRHLLGSFYRWSTYRGRLQDFIHGHTFHGCWGQTHFLSLFGSNFVLQQQAKTSWIKKSNHSLTRSHGWFWTWSVTTIAANWITLGYGRVLFVLTGLWATLLQSQSLTYVQVPRAVPDTHKVPSRCLDKDPEMPLGHKRESWPSCWAYHNCSPQLLTLSLSPLLRA